MPPRSRWRVIPDTQTDEHASSGEFCGVSPASGLNMSSRRFAVVGTSRSPNRYSVRSSVSGDSTKHISSENVVSKYSSDSL
ncbi:MAG: hypothetical protein QF415_06775 [Candidatus Undinarchaeales archaeon]|nr:hypothetical protein [Candidatus Undinarchaeales archaeon]MDP7492652.1 hypothetical protein [Candidatus Undinarchaeales archaeon]